MRTAIAASLFVLAFASQAHAAVDLGTVGSQPLSFPITFFDRTFDSDRDRGGFEFHIVPSNNDPNLKWLSVRIVSLNGNLATADATVDGLEPIRRPLMSDYDAFSLPADNTLRITARSKGDYAATWFRVDMGLFPTPVPAALPLVGSALAALGGLAAWTRRKNVR